MKIKSFCCGCLVLAEIDAEVVQVGGRSVGRDEGAMRGGHPTYHACCWRADGEEADGASRWPRSYSATGEA